MSFNFSVNRPNPAISSQQLVHQDALKDTRRVGNKTPPTVTEFNQHVRSLTDKLNAAAERQPKSETGKKVRLPDMYDKHDVIRQKGANALLKAPVVDIAGRSYHCAVLPDITQDGVKHSAVFWKPGKTDSRQAHIAQGMYMLDNEVSVLVELQSGVASMDIGNNPKAKKGVLVYNKEYKEHGNSEVKDWAVTFQGGQKVGKITDNLVCIDSGATLSASEKKGRVTTKEKLDYQLVKVDSKHSKEFNIGLIKQYVAAAQVLIESRKQCQQSDLNPPKVMVSGDTMQVAVFNTVVKILTNIEDYSRLDNDNMLTKIEDDLVDNLVAVGIDRKGIASDALEKVLIGLSEVAHGVYTLNLQEFDSIQSTASDISKKQAVTNDNTELKSLVRKAGSTSNTPAGSAQSTPAGTANNTPLQARRGIPNNTRDLAITRDIAKKLEIAKQDIGVQQALNNKKDAEKFYRTLGVTDAKGAIEKLKDRSVTPDDLRSMKDFKKALPDIRNELGRQVELLAKEFHDPQCDGRRRYEIHTQLEALAAKHSETPRRPSNPSVFSKLLIAELPKDALSSNFPTNYSNLHHNQQNAVAYVPTRDYKTAGSLIQQPNTLNAHNANYIGTSGQLIASAGPLDQDGSALEFHKMVDGLGQQNRRLINVSFVSPEEHVEDAAYNKHYFSRFDVNDTKVVSDSLSPKHLQYTKAQTFTPLEGGITQGLEDILLEKQRSEVYLPGDRTEPDEEDWHNRLIIQFRDMKPPNPLIRAHGMVDFTLDTVDGKRLNEPLKGKFEYVQVHSQDHQAFLHDEGMIRLANQLAEELIKDSNATVVVNCKAGVGRTGEFCALIEIAKKIKNGEITNKDELRQAIFDTIVEVRSSRTAAIQDTSQLAQLYHLADMMFQQHQGMFSSAGVVDGSQNQSANPATAQAALANPTDGVSRRPPPPTKPKTLASAQATGAGLATGALNQGAGRALAGAIPVLPQISNNDLSGVVLRNRTNQSGTSSAQTAQAVQINPYDKLSPQEIEQRLEVSSGKLLALVDKYHSHPVDLKRYQTISTMSTAVSQLTQQIDEVTALNKQSLIKPQDAKDAKDAGIYIRQVLNDEIKLRVNVLETGGIFKKSRIPDGLLQPEQFGELIVDNPSSASKAKTKQSILDAVVLYKKDGYKQDDPVLEQQVLGIMESIASYRDVLLIENGTLQKKDSALAKTVIEELSQLGVISKPNAGEESNIVKARNGLNELLTLLDDKLNSPEHKLELPYAGNPTKSGWKDAKQDWLDFYKHQQNNDWTNYTTKNLKLVISELDGKAVTMSLAQIQEKTTESDTEIANILAQLTILKTDMLGELEDRKVVLATIAEGLRVYRSDDTDLPTLRREVGVINNELQKHINSLQQSLSSGKTNSGLAGDVIEALARNRIITKALNQSNDENTKALNGLQKLMNFLNDELESAENQDLDLGQAAAANYPPVQLRRNAPPPAPKPNAQAIANRQPLQAGAGVAPPVQMAANDVRGTKRVEPDFFNELNATLLNRFNPLRGQRPKTFIDLPPTVSLDLDSDIYAQVRVTPQINLQRAINKYNLSAEQLASYSLSELRDAIKDIHDKHEKFRSDKNSVYNKEEQEIAYMAAAVSAKMRVHAHDRVSSLEDDRLVKPWSDDDKKELNFEALKRSASTPANKQIAKSTVETAANLSVVTKPRDSEQIRSLRVEIQQAIKTVAILRDALEISKRDLANSVRTESEYLKVVNEQLFESKLITLPSEPAKDFDTPIEALKNLIETLRHQLEVNLIPPSKPLVLSGNREKVESLIMEDPFV